MIGEKETEIPLSGGESKTFILSKFAAVAGREIVTQYPISGLPKLGDYATNEALMLKIMAHVAVVQKEGPPLRLTTRALVDNHIRDWETLARLEWAMMEYNCSFFREGKASTFLDDILAKLPASISSILTHLLESSSPKDSPPSKS